MKKIASLFLLTTILFYGCKQPKHNIQGVWIPANFDMDNTIYHFKENGTLLLRNVTVIPNDSYTTWKIVNDSILDIGNENFRYQMSSMDSVNFIKVNASGGDSFGELVRARKTNITQNKEEIENILLSNIWSKPDSTQFEWDTHFEFFDNETMVYRYDYIMDSLYKPHPIDTLGNLQLEAWKIDAYDDYFFLNVYYNLPLSNGNINISYQLLDIDKNSYEVFLPGRKEGNLKYVAKKNIQFKDLNKEILGTWTAHSSQDEFYSKNLYQDMLNSGEDHLYEGPVKMMIDSEHINFQIDTLQPYKWNWQVNKDGRILLMETKVNEPPYSGIHVEPVDILQFSKNKMKLRLFNNSFYTGSKNPRRVFINQALEFTKQD